MIASKPRDENNRRIIGESRSAWRLPILLLLLVCLTTGIAIYLSKSEKHDSEQGGVETARRTIAEVAPSVVADTPEAIPPATDVKPFWEVDATQTNGFTKMMEHKWRDAHRPPPGYTNDAVKTKAKAPSSIFAHKSENYIAALLTMKPGDAIIGRPNYASLETDFMKSLEHPIIVEDGDSEDDIRLKREVIATKIDLKARIDDGESLQDILAAAQSEYQRLADFKRMMTSELKKQLGECTTAEEVEDFVSAANVLLESKGIAPLKVGPILKNHIIYEEDNSL